MEENLANISSVKKFLRFETVALVLGFIVDSITIIVILLSISLQDANFVLPELITLGLAFIVWFLAVYIYIAYLHRYWEKQVTSENFADKFGMFLLNDLVYGFRKPWQLFPLFILFILLSWIAYAADDQYIGLSFVFVVLFFSLLILWIFKDVIIAKASNNEHKKMIDENWNFLKRRIKAIISSQQWVDCDDFKDVAQVWKISEEAIMYALARYALEYPAQAKFGMVYSRKLKTPVTENYDNVLISLEGLDSEKYFYY